MQRFVRILLLVVFLALFLSGCAAIQRDYSSYRASQSDNAFDSVLRTHAQNVQGVASGVASGIPVTAPFADVIGWIAGSVLYVVASVYHGKTLKKAKGQS